ncbi:MAG: glycosyltransferase family 2 protein [Actinomycetota bacterium]
MGEPGSSLRLSVALCTYNGAAFLPAQLESLAAQERLPDELVVSDDASTDATLEVLDGFASTAPFPVRVARNADNLGFAQNFARVMAMCEGDLIALCDQDDVWKPAKVAAAVAVLAANTEVGLVCSDAELVDAGLAPTGETLFGRLGLKPAERDLVARDRAIAVLLNRNVAMGASTTFRTRFREAILPIPPGWHHDWWVAFVVSLQARLALLDGHLLAYRQHGGNALGAPEAELTAKQRLAVVPPRTAQFLREEQQWRGALERIEALPPEAVRLVLPEDRAYLEAKVRHLRVRAGLPVERWRRVGGVTAELVRGNYQRYSFGVGSALKDLVVSLAPTPAGGWEGPADRGPGSG